MIPLLLLTACSRVGSNPWAGMDFAKAECGTKEAILTTTGCITTPPTAAVANATAIIVPDTNKPISNPDDVNNSHSPTNTDSGYTHGNSNR